MEPVRMLLSVLLGLCFAAGAAAAPTNTVETERLQFADGLFSRGMNELAVKEYQAFVEEFPGSAKADVAWFRMGEAQRNLGNKSGAESAFRQVYTGFPASPYRFRAGYQRADLFMEVGQPQAAADLLKILMKENPPADMLPLVRYLLADALLRVGNGQEAMPLFETVRTSHPGTLQAGYATLRLASIYGGTCDPPVTNAEVKVERALELYREVAAKPVSERLGAEALFHLAELLFARKDFNGSAAAYKELLTKYPKDQRVIEARLQAAWAAHHAGQFAEAMKQTEDALKVLRETKEPTAAQAAEEAQWLYLKANCQRQLGSNEAALATYDELQKKFKDLPYINEVRYERALCWYRLGKYKETLDEAGNVKMKQGARKDVLWIMAESHAALKNTDEAIQYYRLIVNEFPDSEMACDALFRLAHNLQAKGSWKEASQYYSQLAAKYPKHELASRALFASAACFAKAGQQEEAVRDWGRLVKDYPTDPTGEEALYQKAMAELRLKRKADAMTTLKDLAQKNPQGKFKADALFWQGMILAGTNQAAAAVEAYKQALAANPKPELGLEIRFELAMAQHRAGTTNESAVLLFPLLDTPVKARFKPDLVRWLAEYGIAQAQFDNAIRAAKALEETAPDATWKQTGLGLQGRAAFAKGDKVAAEKAYQAALDTKARTTFAAEAALRLGEIKTAAGQQKEAGEFFATAARLATDDTQLAVRARAYVGLARSAKAANDFAAAARYFMSVAVLYDDETIVPECLYEAASAFLLAGNRNESDKAVQELKARYPQSPWTAKPITPPPAK